MAKTLNGRKVAIPVKDDVPAFSPAAIDPFATARSSQAVAA